MDNIPLSALLLAQFGLILLSAFFSGSETGMMAVNRYRLRHLAGIRHKGARRVSRLLEKPEQIIGLILLGNNLVNILAASCATMIGLRLFGAPGIAIATGLLTVVILIFAELAPKTLAARYPERVAFPLSLPLTWLMYPARPLVRLINAVASVVLMPLLGRRDQGQDTALKPEELQSVVREAGSFISDRHRDMLLRILDMDQVPINQIMVPRDEISFINLSLPPSDLARALRECRHAHMPVCRDTLDNVVGVLHTRRLVPFWDNSEDNLIKHLHDLLDDVYYIPEGANVYGQMLYFQKWRCDIGLVVDEYGVVCGLLSMQDILEEIIGEFDAGAPALEQEIHKLDDEGRTFRVDGSVSLRDLNRHTGWELPHNGARTLNGLVLEYLQNIPKRGVSLRVGDYAIEVLRATGNVVRTAKLQQLTTSSDQAADAADSVADDG